jgi:hypothetical protein
MSTRKEFAGSRLKIERAKHHINDLHTQIGGIAVSSLYTLRIDTNAQTGNDVLRVEFSQFLPPLEDFALIIGDALHNLESAMDYAVNEVVFRRLGSHDDYTKFPFRSTRENLIAAINGALVYKASKAVSDFIVNVAQPYEGENDPLWAFNDMNNVDKHRLLIPVLHIKLISRIRLQNDRGDVHISSQAMHPGRRLFRRELNGRNYKITDNGTPSILILFAKGSTREGEAVLPTLRQFTEIVSGLVEGIERVFFAEERETVDDSPRISQKA